MFVIEVTYVWKTQEEVVNKDFQREVLLLESFTYNLLGCTDTPLGNCVTLSPTSISSKGLNLSALYLV